MEATIFKGWITFTCLGELRSKVGASADGAGHRSRKKKSDRIDAGKLADCLRCDFLLECHMASTQIRDGRRTLRYRHPLVHLMTQVKNRFPAC